MKKIQYFCDICLKPFEGSLSVFIANDIFITETLEKRMVSRECHYCEECTEKIKNAIKDIKEKHDAGSGNK